MTRSERVLRLVTFNVHHGVGDDGRHDLARVAAVLTAAEPDVVCLQEVDRHFGSRSEDADQLVVLAGLLGMATTPDHLAFAASIDRPGRTGGLRRRYGNALLSRLPLGDVRTTRLPGGGEPRTALSATVDVAGTALSVTVTHLTTGPAADRGAQAAAVAGLGERPAIVCGDLNTAPDAPELAPLRARFADAWELAALRRDRPGWRRWRAGRGLTHPARSPAKRIDQVWVSPGISVVAARVLSAAGASDHCPLAVDLLVPTAR